MVIIQTFTMARWQIVFKTSEATKQTKDQNDNNKQKNKQNKTKITINETLKWLSSLPILMQESFWW